MKVLWRRVYSLIKHNFQGLGSSDHYPILALKNFVYLILFIKLIFFSEWWNTMALDSSNSVKGLVKQYGTFFIQITAPNLAFLASWSHFLVSVNAGNDVLCTPSEQAPRSQKKSGSNSCLWQSQEGHQELNGHVDWIMCCSFHAAASDAAAVSCYQRIQSTVFCRKRIKRVQNCTMCSLETYPNVQVLNTSFS